jgi:hypothetical protein
MTPIGMISFTESRHGGMKNIQLFQKYKQNSQSLGLRCKQYRTHDYFFLIII